MTWPVTFLTWVNFQICAVKIGGLRIKLIILLEEMLGLYAYVHLNVLIGFVEP